MICALLVTAHEREFGHTVIACRFQGRCIDRQTAAQTGVGEAVLGVDGVPEANLPTSEELVVGRGSTRGFVSLGHATAHDPSGSFTSSLHEIGLESDYAN